ncbi:TIGR03089 family protein [Gordonia hongkongensis]|uniref:TIGR03089 family protein n=1 Tax=Gordonia hongkongensis TaxID=1701090 RepID=UPI001FF7D8A3|nr:TIGR03089 family protein [Gordonia hongkongensis]UPG69903.1 TIGR03089 family protein [Gordonia hongkongensis]
MRELTPNTVTDAIFAAVTDHSRPLLTYYDDSTGERTELSGATLGNWAAKTANYLVDEIGIIDGAFVGVDLPEHWQTAGILLGALWAGAEVHFDTPDDGMVLFTSRDRLDSYPDVDEVVVASLDPFALPLRDLPPGVGDYGSVVRVHGDQYSSRYPVSATLEGAPIDEVLDDARATAEREGIGPGARVVSTRPWYSGDRVIAHLLAPLLAGGSLVHVSAASPERLAAIAEMEKATLILS